MERQSKRSWRSNESQEETREWERFRPWSLLFTLIEIRQGFKSPKRVMMRMMCLTHSLIQSQLSNFQDHSISVLSILGWRSYLFWRDDVSKSNIVSTKRVKGIMNDMDHIKCFVKFLGVNTFSVSLKCIQENNNSLLQGMRKESFCLIQKRTDTTRDLSLYCLGCFIQFEQMPLTHDNALVFCLICVPLLPPLDNKMPDISSKQQVKPLFLSPAIDTARCVSCHFLVSASLTISIKVSFGWSWMCLWQKEMDREREREIHEWPHHRHLLTILSVISSKKAAQKTIRLPFCKTLAFLLSSVDGRCTHSIHGRKEKRSDLLWVQPTLSLIFRESCLPLIQ